MNRAKGIGWMWRWGMPLFLLLLSTQAGAVNADEPKKMKGLTLKSVSPIWADAPHSAFTDLIRFEDQWFCTFREASGHKTFDGKIRVLSSPDGQAWRSVLMIEDSLLDLRDPKLSVTPRGKLMLHYLGVYKDTVGGVRVSTWAQFSTNGLNWGRARKTDLNNEFAFRITWYKGTGYTITWSYMNKVAKLYETRDGIHFDSIATFNINGWANEAAIVFGADDEMKAVIRREYQPKALFVGVSSAPYTKWTFTERPYFAGGPNMLVLPDSSVLVSFRHYEGGEGQMNIYKLDGNNLSEVLRLPCGGDTGYPGMVWYGDELWMSYYSSHEGKAKIYLARIGLVVN